MDENAFLSVTAWSLEPTDITVFSLEMLLQPPSGAAFLRPFLPSVYQMIDFTLNNITVLSLQKGLSCCCITCSVIVHSLVKHHPLSFVAEYSPVHLRTDPAPSSLINTSGPFRLATLPPPCSTTLLSACVSDTCSSWFHQSKESDSIFIYLFLSFLVKFGFPVPKVWFLHSLLQIYAVFCFFLFVFFQPYDDLKCVSSLQLIFTLFCLLCVSVVSYFLFILFIIGLVPGWG